MTSHIQIVKNLIIYQSIEKAKANFQASGLASCRFSANNILSYYSASKSRPRAEWAATK
ncbi:hypothetical protein WwAna0756 [Wolbachia endosymbiont of Drosophila ananassae]|nr:hypothetical protein WwAna0756 [Wolbachia endosymbiont of Drosophila ananassae]